MARSRKAGLAQWALVTAGDTDADAIVEPTTRNPDGEQRENRAASFEMQTLLDDLKRFAYNLHRPVNLQIGLNAEYLGGSTLAEVLEEAGNVDGPASSTDSAVALWDGTDGRTLKNSGVTVDGSNNVVTPGNVTAARDLKSAPGSAAAPAFSWTDPSFAGAGMFAGADGAGADAVCWSMGGTTRAAITAQGLQIQDGSEAAPSLYFVGSNIAGIYLNTDTGNGPALVDTSGVTQLYIQSTGVHIPGKLTVDGLIDPTGLELTPVAANPGGVAANTLWLDSGNSHVLKHGANRVMLGSNNLSEVTNAATARSNIGAGTGDGDVSLTGIFVTGNLVKSTSGGDIEDAGFAPSAVYRSGGTDVPITDGGTGASDADGAINNIVSAATSRTPALADRFPFEVASHASQAGAATFQQALNLIGSLTAETTLDPANDKIALYDNSGAATDSMTPQVFMNGMQNLAQATSATRNFKLLALDASNVAKYVNLDDLDPTGQILICRTVSYTGSGSSGKTVTLTGINRAHVILLMKQATGGTANVPLYMPLGATGSITHNDLANATGYTEDSLSAPAAGTDQVLTLNTTHGSRNASGVTYRVVVWGTPT